jgi:hypothetical protein
MDQFVILRASSLQRLTNDNLRSLIIAEGATPPSGWGSKSGSIARLQKHGLATHFLDMIAASEAQEESKARIAEEKATARKEKAVAARAEKKQQQQQSQKKKPATKRRRTESEEEDSDDSYEE